MEISREYAVKELAAIQAVIAEWLDELGEPKRINESGEAVPMFPGGIPPNIPVSQLGLPISQLRAELAGCAGRIEALITAG